MIICVAFAVNAFRTPSDSLEGYKYINQGAQF